MSKLNTQFGESLTGDFEENTWTFKMPETFKLTAGDFAIIPKEKHNTALEIIDNLLKIEEGAFKLNSFYVAKLKMALRTIKHSLE